ncbi:MAG: carbohydrate-binding protein, partial [Marinoscillum sp.]
QWGDMIYMLIRDAANPSRTDTMFPFLRNFSPYAGHCWANGFAVHPHGNDQESTSESMQFNSALIHWGSVTGNDAIRDLGIFLYTTELTAIQEYWFDVEERSFQPEYDYEMVARVWTGGYDNGTWWTSDVAASYGIQLYPIHAGSLYLGHRTDYIQRVWTEMTQNTEVLSNTPNANLWYDTYWKFLSFLDADEALNLYRNYTERDIKVGISDAQTYHWLHSMASMGQVATDITANYPIASVFRNSAGAKTYVAHNYSNTSITVNFSDGYSLNVPSMSMATNKDSNITVNITTNTTEVATGGSVNLSATVSGSGVTSVSFYRDETLIGTDNTAPYSLNSGTLSAGNVQFYARANAGSVLEISNVVSVQVGLQTAYGGTPPALPGTIEAGHYDSFEGGNGQGVSYADNDAFNQGDFRTSEGVDASNTTGEGATVGWIGAGEWLEYTVNATQAGQYDLTIRFASDNASGGGPFWLERDGVQISPTINVPSTGGWGTYQDQLVEGVSLIAGEQVIRVAFGGAGFNLGRMTFEYTGNNNPVLTTITVSPASATITEGNTQQFTAQGFDQNGDPMSTSFNWSATGGSIDGNGLFSGSATGNFTVTASSGGVQGTASIAVNPVFSGITLPGKVEAEDYNEGGYYDTSAGNSGTAYRNDNVDIEPTGDTGGGYNVGWTAVGEWLEYDINATASSGLYDISVRTASPSGAGQLHIEIDGVDVTGSIATPNTGGWQNYVTTTIEDVAISTGNHVLRIAVDAAGFNINYVEGTEADAQQPVLTSITVSPGSASIDQGQTQQFSAQGYDQNGNPMTTTVNWTASAGSINSSGLYTGSTTGNHTVTATSGSVNGNANVTVNRVTTGIAIPGRVEAEDFNSGGQNVGYYDTSSGNTGGAFRTSEDVDIEGTGDSEGTYNVGWTAAGEWLEYDINATASDFDISMRVASAPGGGSLRVEIDGSDVTGPIAVPATGGWQAYQSITVENIAITPGNHTMRIHFIAAGINLNYVDFTENTSTPTGCNQTAANGDYTVAISSDSSNPTLTFEPGYAGIGNPTTLLYYGTSPTGPYPGYGVSPNTPFQLNASSGQTIYFYYTYSVPEGGERNTSANKHSFVVGNCGSGSRIASNDVISSAELSINVFPNPTSESLFINLGETSFNTLKLVD